MSKSFPFGCSLLLVVLLCYCATPVSAFGAGNIGDLSVSEGVNWRHGDITDVLLKLNLPQCAGGKAFTKLMISRVYFGNFLRDYSQVLDVGTLKSLSPEALRLIVAVLAFLSFGYGSKEFEVTRDRLGVYRPEEHIDNPQGYDEGVPGGDPQAFDPRLRAQVKPEEVEIDSYTGMKAYIASYSLEQSGNMTSSYFVRLVLQECIRQGRKYRDTRDKVAFYDGLRYLGTALHCLEDFLAHSNYVELALQEMGEIGVFPHVGRNTALFISSVNHEVFPIVTGTFGSSDLFHSLVGEASDKLIQAEQHQDSSEMDQMNQTILSNQDSESSSVLRQLLDGLSMIPDNPFSGLKDKMDQLEASNSPYDDEISPNETEDFTLRVQEVGGRFSGLIEFHDDLMKKLSKLSEQFPFISKIIGSIEEAVATYIFTLLAPAILPLLSTLQAELTVASEHIIESNKEDHHIVFNDDDCTNPTHSMLAKDHFTNILNSPGGTIASKMVEWVVPQIFEAWDDESIDPFELTVTIAEGVLHHPAQRVIGREKSIECRSIMFAAVEEWWNSKDEDSKEEYRWRLSREGVEQGLNHTTELGGGGGGCGGQPIVKMHMNYQNEDHGGYDDHSPPTQSYQYSGGQPQTQTYPYPPANVKDEDQNQNDMDCCGCVAT